MPKKLRDTLNGELLRFLSESAEGAGIDAVLRQLRPISKRTLQRRLAGLIREGRVTTTGEARALHYHLTPVTYTFKAPMPAPAVREAQESIPLSPAGAALRDQIRKPLIQRQPVGYNRAFLDAYHANITTYLTPDILSHLHRIGQAPNVERTAGTYARSILKRLLIDLSWASSRLEGNTYSLLDTERLLEAGEAAQGKAAIETQMILNHRDAIEFAVAGASDAGIGVNGFTIKNLHALLANNLLPDPAAGGRLRAAGVAIGHSVYLPLSGGPIVAAAFERLIATGAAIRDPFELAFFLMVHLPYLQPFDDVNKRVSRLAANIPFIKHELCPLSFIEVPEQQYIDGLLAVYELNRIELLRDVFIWAYERSALRYVAVRQSLGEPDQFRLRYRDAMITLVQGIVQRKVRPTPEEIRTAAQGQGVMTEHLEHFVRLVQQELNSLHEGNFARFRLRPSEFEAWRHEVKTD